MKLVLHIGPHKTGSTFIQKVLFEQVGDSRHQSMTYPESEVTLGFGHHAIAEAALTASEDEMASTFGRILVQDRTNIISSENFDRLDAKQVRRLGSSLSGIDTEIVYYFRPFAELLPSEWQENIKHGSTQSFHHFALEHFSRPFSSKIINPMVVLQRYMEAFGKERIHIVDYKREDATRGILEPLLSVAGETLIVSPQPRINRSMDTAQTELLRHMNIRFDRDRRLNGLNVRQAFLRRRKEDETVRDLILSVTHCMSRYRLAWDLDGVFLANLFARKTEKAFEGRVIGDSLTRSSGQRITAFRGEWVNDPDVRSSLDELHARISENLEG